MNPPITPPIWVFATRLVMEMINASHLPIMSKNCKATSFLYDSRGGREGVFAKGLRLKDRVVVKKVLFDGDNWEVEALAPSESDPKTTYVVKVYAPLDFECNCPWGSYRFRPCKHVYAVILKVFEIAGADVRDPVLQYYVHEGLNRLAYHKAKTARDSV
jgi:hypothetical protein